jgi:hypothetical protein
MIKLTEAREITALLVLGKELNSAVRFQSRHAAGSSGCLLDVQPLALVDTAPSKRLGVVIENIGGGKFVNLHTMRKRTPVLVLRPLGNLLNDLRSIAG